MSGVFVGVSCCVLPLFLASVGLVGAWIASLEVFCRLSPSNCRRSPHSDRCRVVDRVPGRSSWSTVLVLGCASVLVLGALVLMN
jgi:hypothetical protein